MSVLLLADIVNGYLNREVTAKAINAVQSLGSVTVLCAGSQAQVAGTYVAQIAGVTNVVTVESSLYDHNLAEPMAALLVSISDAFSYVVAPSTSDSKNILPRVAALLDVMMISDVSAVISGDTFERSAYAGSVIQKVKSRDSKKILTIRTANFNAAPDGGNAPVSSAEPAGNSGLSEWVEDVMAITERPDLTSAKRVVSGGRGLASKENFALIEKCADKIGAAVGASRAAVDAGFVPNDLQVGQTGKVVAPELYVAIGISGAIQHLAGMKDSKVIVAINKDEDAPIFKIADFGIVGDLFEVIPQLTDRI